jgi:hypothetical protein
MHISDSASLALYIISSESGNKHCIPSLFVLYTCFRAGCGRDRMLVGFTTTYATVPITTNVVSLNPAHREVYSIQHYVIKFVSDLQQVGGFLQLLWFPQPKKLTATI